MTKHTFCKTGVAAKTGLLKENNVLNDYEKPTF